VEEGKMTERQMLFAQIDSNAVALLMLFVSFARHVGPIVVSIAGAQLLMAVLVTLRGNAVRVGLAGAIVFLVAILPLGVGAGFPATLTMALAAAVLFRHRFDESLWGPVRLRLASSRHPRPLAGG
jgi:hypothetical protein